MAEEEMTQEQQSDPARIAALIEELAHVAGDADGGVSRLAFTAAEREAHQLVADQLTDYGLKVWQDAIGNTIGELPGQTPGLSAIGSGSHLDSVPHGGRFDGVAGVVAAVEVARLLAESDRPLTRPYRVVAFAAEEGARFGEPCIGSKAVAGQWKPDSLDQLRDAEGVTAGDALRRLGLDPGQVETCRWSPNEWAAFFEVHIEQARVLEATSRPIGLVDIVSGSTRVEMRVIGRAQHTGGTPMALRRDALAAASEIVLFAEQLANDPRYRGARATIGRLDVSPNSITTIPGQVDLVLDLRDVDNERQRQAAADVVRGAKQICDRRGTTCQHRIIADSSPAVLPVWLRDFTLAACEELGLAYRVMTSGASHDSQVVNRVIPAAMVFVPSKDGLSHVPTEWTSSMSLANGADVLLRSVRQLDHFLSTVEVDRDSQ